MTRKWYATLRHPQDTSTQQIWNSYLKEYRRYASDTKRDGQTERLLYASQSSFGGIKSSICISLCNPCRVPILWPQEHNLYKLGRGPLEDAIYQGSSPCGFRQEDVFMFSLYKPM